TRALAFRGALPDGSDTKGRPPYGVVRDLCKSITRPRASMKARTLKSSTRRTRVGARARGDQHLQALSRIARASESADDERARERLLFVRYQRNGDMAAREELVKRFLPLARRLARRYERASEPLEDLVQVASVGLVKAIDRFETEQGTG